MTYTTITIPYDRSNFATLSELIEFVSIELSRQFKKLTVKQRKESRTHLTKVTKTEVVYTVVEFHETSVMKEGK
jgi:hypothetical protein